MIPAGTSIELTVVGSTGEIIPRTADDLRQAAITAMDEFLTVESVGVARDAGGLFRQWWDYGYTATVRVRTIHTHAKIDDVILIVKNAFTYAASTPPLEQKAVPTVTAYGYTQDQVTGPTPGGTEKEPESPGLLGLGTFAIVALIAIVATAVFVAKRG